MARLAVEVDLHIEAAAQSARDAEESSSPSTRRRASEATREELAAGLAQHGDELTLTPSPHLTAGKQLASALALHGEERQALRAHASEREMADALESRIAELAVEVDLHIAAEAEARQACDEAEARAEAESASAAEAVQRELTRGRALEAAEARRPARGRRWRRRGGGERRCGRRGEPADVERGGARGADRRALAARRGDAALRRLRSGRTARPRGSRSPRYPPRTHASEPMPPRRG